MYWKRGQIQNALAPTNYTYVSCLMSHIPCTCACNNVYVLMVANIYSTLNSLLIGNISNRFSHLNIHFWVFAKRKSICKIFAKQIRLFFFIIIFEIMLAEDVAMRTIIWLCNMNSCTWLSCTKHRISHFGKFFKDSQSIERNKSFSIFSGNSI